MSDLAIVNADLFGRLVDIGIDGATITIVTDAGSHRTDAGNVIDAEGAAVIPGLHDHHIHLFATAAAAQSVFVGPPEVVTIEQLVIALRSAPGSGWVRGVGYHESVAGDLDRDVLDRLCPDRPLRVQDRTGIRWTLNSPALDALAGVDHPGIERDSDGRPTGRLRRADDLVRDLPPFVDGAALERLCRALISRGVTGVTDATPYEALADLGRLADRPLPITATGGVALAAEEFPDGLSRGPVKVLLDEASLPDLADLTDWYRIAHAAGRGLAVHCVDASTVAMCLAAVDEAGAHPGDRLEHGSLIHEATIREIARRGFTIVSQPGLIAERGDQYLADVDQPDDLYRVASLRRAGIPVALSTDAPYTAADPWAAIAAAVDRRTPSGAVIGPKERVDPLTALTMFTGTATRPATPRRVAAGEPADLVVLTEPWSTAPRKLTSDLVRATILAGAVTNPDPSPNL